MHETLAIVKRWNTKTALAGNRTRNNCLEGNYVNHYTTNALERNTSTLAKLLYVIVVLHQLMLCFIP